VQSLESFYLYRKTSYWGSVLKTFKVKLAAVLVVTLSSVGVSTVAFASSIEGEKSSYTGQEVLSGLLPYVGCYAYFNRGDFTGVVGEKLDKGTLIYDVASSDFKPVKVTFGYSERVKSENVLKWLVDEVGVSQRLALSILTTPEELRQSSCSVRYRYELSDALSALYKKGTSRDHICRALAEVGYKLRYNGTITKVGEHSNERGYRSYRWVNGSKSLPWEALHTYANRAKWSTGMMNLYFQRYLDLPADKLIKALEKTKNTYQGCKSFYPDNKPKVVEQQELYTGYDVIAKVLPRVGYVSQRLVDGVFEKVDPNDFHSGETFYKITASSGRIKSFKVTFNPKDLLSHTEVKAWLKKELKFSGATTIKAIG